MKKCPWCGKEYPDDTGQCAIDGTALAKEARPRNRQPAHLDNERVPQSQPIVLRRYSCLELGPDWRPALIDLAEISAAFEFCEGYSRPNWKVIAPSIQERVSTANVGEAWTEAAIQWGLRLRSDLGQGYHLRRSGEFLLLSEQETVAAEEFLSFAEQTLELIHDSLRDAAWQTGQGKHVILLFTEEDDYYQYVSYYYRDGVHPASGACLIHRDYVHIAMAYRDGRHIRRALSHELVHNCVVHLHLPLWLNEGLAVAFDRRMAERSAPIIDHDLRDRHLAFWNAVNIQKFWSGVSFREPGDSNELSYSLAEILVNLLVGHSADFVAFLKQADRNDAGQTAAVDVLESDLGQVATTFLGEGDWRPNRKAILECWKQQEDTRKAAD
jgi:hypothetical protein